MNVYSKFILMFTIYISVVLCGLNQTRVEFEVQNVVLCSEEMNC